jgi:hypothetical protein
MGRCANAKLARRCRIADVIADLPSTIAAAAIRQSIQCVIGWSRTAPRQKADFSGYFTQNRRESPAIA